MRTKIAERTEDLAARKSFCAQNWNTGLAILLWAAWQRFHAVWSAMLSRYAVCYLRSFTS